FFAVKPNSTFNMFLKYISLVILLGSTSYGANILGIIPTTSYSHQIAYAHLWKELSLRGHKVTTITSNPLKDPTLTNLTEIDVNWLYKYYDAVSNTLDMSISMWHIYDIWIQFMVFMSDEQLSYAPIQNLIHNKTNFDIVLVESFFPEFLGFAEIYKCPKILISSFQTNAYYHHAMGNPIHPLLHPDIMTPFYGALNFKERVTATLFGWYLSYFFSHKIIPEKEAILRKYFNVEATVEELVYDVDMLFINENPAVQEAKAVGPTTINIGGLRQPISPNSLPQEIQEYLDNATEGFIYFSLGTNIRSKDLDEQTLRTLNEVFEEVPYKVLWKFEADELPGKPENIKLIKWAPQQNVLSHPNIKLFITQAGLQSMEETITSEVPCVVIPIYADQEKNAKLMKRKGFAEIVERTPFLEKEELKKSHPGGYK
ncbi:hypothetical protein NQ314_008477, partial [Rhamnusium bicolor]